MEVSGVGTYLNSINNDSFVNRAKSEISDVSTFEEMLRRTASSSDPRLPNPEPQGGNAAARFAKIDKTDKLYEQCVELEIFLVKTLVSSMRNTIQKSGLIDEGYAGKMYEDMLYDEYAKNFAKNANFGMAEMAYLELTGQRGKTVLM